MAKYVYKTQTKTSFWYSYGYLNLLIFLAFTAGVAGVFLYHMPNFIFLVFFILIIYNIYFYKPTVKYWDMGKNDTLTIDTDKKSVTLGKSKTIQFKNIQRVKLVLDERPTMFWFLTFPHQYINLINGELKFFMEDSTENTGIYIQNKKTAKKIVDILNANKIHTSYEHEERMKENVPAQVWMLIILVILIWQFVRGILYVGGKIFT